MNDNSLIIRYYEGNKTIREAILLFSYSLYLIVYILGSCVSFPSFVFPMVNLGISVLLLIGILIQKITIRNIILCCALGLACLVISVFSGNLTTLIIILLFIVCANDMDYHLYVQRYFLITSVLMLSIVILYFFGITNQSQWERTGQGIRYSLGFRYTTFGPMYFMCIVFSYLSIKRKEINFVETIVILTLNYLLYYFTNTRGVYFLVILVVLFFWIKKYIPSIFKSKFYYIISVWSIPIMAALCIIAPLMYNKIFYQYDEFFSDRIRYGKYAIDRYGLSSLFGNNITWTSTKDGNLVDSSYLRILLQYGWIFFILIILGFMFVQHRNFKMKNYALSIVVFFIMIHSVTDPQLLDIQGNPFIFLLGYIYASNKTKISQFKLHARNGNIILQKRC